MTNEQKIDRLERTVKLLLDALLAFARPVEMPGIIAAKKELES
jgi:hypothetical protein